MDPGLTADRHRQSGAKGRLRREGLLNPSGRGTGSPQRSLGLRGGSLEASAESINHTPLPVTQTIPTTQETSTVAGALTSVVENDSVPADHVGCLVSEFTAVVWRRTPSLREGCR